MKLHYSPAAAAARNWTTASATADPACGMSPRGRHSGAILMGTSLAESVTCAKCQAVLTASR